jgi:hypothetical protein
MKHRSPFPSAGSRAGAPPSRRGCSSPRSGGVAPVRRSRSGSRRAGRGRGRPVARGREAAAAAALTTARPALTTGSQRGDAGPAGPTPAASSRPRARAPRRSRPPPRAWSRTRRPPRARDAAPACGRRRSRARRPRPPRVVVGGRLGELEADAGEPLAERLEPVADQPHPARAGQLHVRPELRLVVGEVRVGARCPCSRRSSASRGPAPAARRGTSGTAARPP